MRPGDLLDDRFVIERGGTGRVFRARDLHDHAAVAVKVLDETDDRERFRREAELLARCRHPALARYIAHGPTYLVQEWIDGQTLAQRLAGTGVTIREAVAIVRAVADALGVLHAQGVVHRDVKPANIILAAGGPRLVDLGVALPLATDSQSHSLTRTGAFVGTPGYTSPEQALGHKHAIGPASDVFALGAILYECLTGMPAFAGINALARTTKVLLADPMPVGAYASNVPPSLGDVVARMLAKDPAKRIATIAELLAALPSELPAEVKRDSVESIRIDLLGRAEPRMTIRLRPDDRLACVILALPPEHGMPPPAEGVQVHGDGSLTGVVAGPDPAEVVARAARYARELGRAVPDTPIAVVGCPAENGVANADPLEWAFVALEVAAVKLAFLPGTLAVQIDEHCAALLPPDIPVTREDDAYFLV